MLAKPHTEHQWLEQLVGEWDTEMEARMAPGEPPSKHVGTETVRSLSVWVLCEGTSAMLDGTSGRTVMTLGYDPTQGKFVGTFVGSMMTYLWVYQGTLDATGNVLTLDAEGPIFTDSTRTTRYKDTIEIRSPDDRVMTSRFLGDDGQWHLFMTAHYRRKSAPSQSAVAFDE